ncbi:MAG TPA: hypothetical protein VEX11_11715 [Acetobacteraceae bacterium]|nr:hypothetical protein [Acetobacteraceae bacterium]
MHKAALFSAVLERNALRRAALLPPLDVGQEFRRAIAEAGWREYQRRCSAEADALARCREEAVAECRKRFGPAFDPRNLGSRILVARETERRFCEHVRAVLGADPPSYPAQDPIVYGGARSRGERPR